MARAAMGRQLVSLINRARPAERNPAHLLFFILFFPHLIAGPIVRATTILAATLLALEEVFGAEKGGEAVLAAIREVKAELGSELQAFYKDHVQTFEGTSEVYKQLIGQHGEADFLESSETLIKKLGGDIQAQGRAMDGSELKAKLDSLYHLEVARNTYTAFAALLDKIAKFQAA